MCTDVDGINIIFQNTINDCKYNNETVGYGEIRTWEIIRPSSYNILLPRSLGYVKGTMKDVVAYASQIDGIYDMGCYGYLSVIPIGVEIGLGYFEKVISGQIKKERDELLERKKKLEEELKEIDSKLK